MARSLRGLYIGIVATVVVFGGLFAWGLLRRPGAVGLVSAWALALVLVPAAVSFARAPFTITIHDEGLLLLSHGGRTELHWIDVTEARLWRAPVGRQPRVLTLRDRRGALTTLSEAE